MPFSKIVKQLNKIQLNRTGCPEETTTHKTNRVEYAYIEVIEKVKV